MKVPKLFKNITFVALITFLFGALVILAIRFATYKTPHESVHYHANFAVYVNGQREEFKALKYYEETSTATCSVQNAASEENNPMTRVHMHNQENDVVHVEDHLVSWANFFSVLGWGVGNNYLATDSQVYTSGDQGQVTYILNGKKVSNIANTIIGDQDKLLVSYGTQSSDELQSEYDGIKNNALKEDNSKDPASCGGNETVPTTFHDRITHLF